MKYFIVTQFYSIGNGYKTITHLVIDPEIVNGGLRATKVGELDWKRMYDEDVNPEEKSYFKRCKSGPAFYIGNALCDMYEGDDPFLE
jgi:hypothetical protein